MINLSNFLSWLNNAIWNIPFLSILIFFGIYLSIKLKFPQISVIKKVFSIPFMYFKSIRNKDNTDIKSLMSILAGTLGMGNITGVASAILMSASMYALTLASGYVYLKALCMIAERKGANFNAEDLSNAVNAVLKEKTTIKEVFDAAKENYKK